MNQRFHDLHVFILTVVVLYAVSIQSLLVNLNPVYSSVLTVLTSIGFYRIVIVSMFALINRNDLFLMYYWNKYFLKGFWSYTYTIDGNSYNGFWRIEQDIYGTKFYGSGVNSDRAIRSIYWSVTDLIENAGSLEVVMNRIDSHTGVEHYSLTTMILQYEKDRWYLPAVPYKMRAVTHNYGGEINGKLHNDLIVIKHVDAKNEDDVLKLL